MENFGSRQTTLDLNGPTFTWLTEPTALEFCSAGIGTFIGIATATFPVQIPVNPAANDGYITYQWYVDGYGALTDGTIVSLGFTGITGSASTTLTVYGSSPTSHNKKFYVRPEYVPSAYAQPIGTTVTAGTARSTPNATNENFDSDLCNLTIYPTIGITSQPAGATLPILFETANFHIIDTISDTTQGDLTYQWTSNGVDLANGTGSPNIVSGAQTKDLSLLSDTIGIQTIQCRILHPTSCDAPLYSDVVEYDAISPDPIIKYEVIAEGSGQLRTTGEQNLNTNKLNITYGAYFNGGKGGTQTPDPRNDIIVVYSPFQDVAVNILLAGAHGALNGLPGGPGGVGSFDFTLERGTEYVFSLGANGVVPSPGGGYGAGGGTFFYRGANLVACVGGGGGGGACGRGGDGGGISQNGTNGTGGAAGVAGIAPSDGSLPTRGFFPGGSETAYTPYGRTLKAMNGGRVSACTWGSWYINRAYSPCKEIGISYYRGNDGTENTNTALIMRSYKAGPSGGSGDGGNTGWIYRQNGGNGGWGASVGYNGDGGGGATGGQGGHRSHSGGGGGSGYSNGEPTNTQIITPLNKGDSYFEIAIREV